MGDGQAAEKVVIDLCEKDFVCAKSQIEGTDSGAYGLVARLEYQYSNLSICYPS